MKLSTSCNYTILLIVIALFVACNHSKNGDEHSQIKYKPTWESLSKYPGVPEWLKDAKFGIYTHWGPITVASTDGGGWAQWYGRNMYMKDSPAFEYHQKKFGNQDSIGYKDIIPKFTAKNFDADNWAKLFKKAGAKFAGPVAIHHDNFAMWNSKVTRWNSVNMGPHKDIVGALERSIKAEDMHFMTSFHHSFTWDYFLPAYQYDAADSSNADLYGDPHKKDDGPDQKFLKAWLAKIDEVVDNYKPSLIWFDMGFYRTVPEEYEKKMFADYYNWTQKNNVQGVVVHKSQKIRQYTGMMDFERGRADTLTSYTWMTDTSIGPWFNQKSRGYKSANELIDVLADIVSKNGVLLLNVGPKADGTFPDQARKLLTEIGQWLSVNGEAIYNTRPWDTYGEGPNKMGKSGKFSERKAVKYDARDIRYTRSKDDKTLYAIILGWPGSGKQITFKSIKQDTLDVNSVSMISSEMDIDWDWKNDHLQVTMPSEKVDDKAVVVKIGFE